MISYASSNDLSPPLSLRQFILTLWDSQGHQGFTPEYVIKNQTKPHLRNYSFLHSHFLTSSQTKLLTPWTFFNVHYIIRCSENSRKAVSRRRHRGFGSLHLTALRGARWGNKVIEHGRTICSTLTAGDWALSAYTSKPVYLVLRDCQ